MLIGWVGLCLVAHRLGGIQDKNITLARTTLGRAKDAFWLLALPIYSSMAIGLSLAGVAVSDGSGRKSVAVGCAVAALASMVVTGFRASKVFDTLDSLEQELEQKDAAEKLVA